MVFINNHSKEVYLLQRRIKFLEMLDELIERDAGPDEAVSVASQFKEIERPQDLINGIRSIYKDDLDV